MIGQTVFNNGQPCNVVLLAGRDNPKGAVCLFANPEGGAAQTAPLEQMLECFSPGTLVSILCMQERQFGQSGLPKPSLT